MDKSLRDIQSWMQSALIHPQALFDSQATSLEEFVADSEKLSAREHLAIYQRSYLGRLRNCMSTQFSALEYALGKELFRMFADEYLQNCPSESYNLTDLGRNFSNFLAETRPDKDQEQKEDWPDFMIELADFEYNITLIFDEHAEEDYQPADLDTPEEAIDLIPVFHLFQHQFPISAYYSAFSNDQSPELPFPQKSHCLILRHNYRLGLYELHEAQYEFLRHFQQNRSVKQALEGMISQGTDPLQLKEVWSVWKHEWTKRNFFRKKGTA